MGIKVDNKDRGRDDWVSNEGEGPEGAQKGETLRRRGGKRKGKKLKKKKKRQQGNSACSRSERMGGVSGSNRQN